MGIANCKMQNTANRNESNLKKVTYIANILRPQWRDSPPPSPEVLLPVQDSCGKDWGVPRSILSTTQLYILNGGQQLPVPTIYRVDRVPLSSPASTNHEICWSIHFCWLTSYWIYWIGCYSDLVARVCWWTVFRLKQCHWIYAAYVKTAATMNRPHY